MKNTSPPPLRRNLLFACSLILLCSVFGLRTARGQAEALVGDSLVYDGAANLRGETGGYGWSHPWAGGSPESFLGTDKGVKVDGPTTGGPEGRSVGAVRRFVHPTPDGVPIYFSIEVEIPEITGQYCFILKLHQSPTGALERLVGIGIMNNQVFGMGGVLEAKDGMFEGVTPPGTFLLVGRIAFEEGDVANLSVWVNPKDQTSTESMGTLENIGVSRMPFLLAELLVSQLDGPGSIVLRNLVVSTEWPVPARE